MFPDHKSYLLSSRSSLHKTMGNLSKARQDLDNAIRIDPLYTYAYKQRAEMNISEERLEEALLDYGKLI